MVKFTRILYKCLYEFIIINIGSICLSIGTSVFLLPNKLSNGGFLGIATVIYYFFDIPISYTILILNVPLFIWGYTKLGKKFILKSVYATIIYSILVDYINELLSNNFIFNVLEIDIFLASVYGGIFSGIGLALIYKVNGTTGGTDIIAHIVKIYNKNIRASQIIVYIDFVVVFMNLIIFKELKIGLYSWITIYIIGKIIDIVFEGINFCKLVLIISDKYEEIAYEIIHSLNKGATSIYSKGLYLNNDKEIIMCIVKRNEVGKIKNLSKQIDRNSFIIIVDSREVLGLGFK